ncbi:hypothetical protein C8Q78DRAFT_972600 [Trametes maxima]|nr:hypothetical protein C8Q78DRAFT_972600 [Trametes maxima]
MRPPPLPAARFATPVSTMPGSLFPRSASLIPETPAIPQRTVPRPRTPPPAPQTIIEEAEEEMVEEAPEQPRKRGRSQDRRSSHPTDENGDTARPSSLRDSSRHSDASGRAASSSRRSLDDPEEPVSRPRSRKGKERACDTSGEVRVRGKERELREAREDHARNAHERDGREREHDKQRIRMLEEEVARLRAELASKGSGSMMPPPPPPPPPPPLFRPQATTILSGENGSYLASARALLKPTAPPVEAPINGAAYGGARAKKAGHPTVNVPSDKMAAFLREMKNVRLRRVGGLTGDTSMSSATAAGAVGETAGDLNRSTSGTGMSRARMAATLGERSFDLGVATRLEIGEKRKRDAFEESVAGPSKRRETTFLHSNDTGASTSASSSQSSTSSSQSSSSSQTSSFSAAQSSSSRTSLFEMPPPRSQPARPRNSAPLRIWPTGSMAETDLTTPSLCSDNENDHEAEDKLPETPSDSGRGSKSKDAGMLEPKREPEHEVIDVDALDTPPKRAATPKRPVVDKNDAFSRRPPASPLPASSKTPSKPRPPARAAKSKIPLPQAKRAPAPQPEDDRGSESDDPLAAAPVKPESRGRSYSAQDDPPRPGPSRIRRNSSASSSVRSGSHTRETRPASRLSNHARRRLTLDEEMRRAGDSLWQPSEDEQGAAESPDEEGPETGLDSGELVALGTRSSKRGFLARGGGAGVPVFMAEGYVRGASSKEGEGSAVRSRSNTGESARSRAGESSRRRR